MNPFLHDKAIGIGGKPGTRSIIAAASIEAKRRGVKTIMNAHEALRMCPELEIINGDANAYEYVTEIFLKIFAQYTDVIEVFSIDEAFLDVTAWHARWGTPEKLALRIKADIKKQLGAHITCSIGIAPNKLLAKLASDLKKPNGLVRIKQKDIPYLFAFCKLTDICGIGERLQKHLNTLGIYTLLDLGNTPHTTLTHAFGSVTGTKLWLIGRGEDPSPVLEQETEAKSFGNSYTLPKDTTDTNLLYKMLFRLVEKTSARMRAEDFLAQHISIIVRYSDFTHNGSTTSLKHPTDDPVTLMHTAWQAITPLLEKTLPIRLLGFTCTNLVKESGQISIWPSHERRHTLFHTADKINNKYGNYTAHAATTTNTVLKRHVSGFINGTDLKKERRHTITNNAS